MNRLELGKYWLEQLCRVMPDASSRMVTRMAWHLASLAIQDYEELMNLPEASLAQSRVGSQRFLELRAQYARRLSSPNRSSSSGPASGVALGFSATRMRS